MSKSDVFEAAVLDAVFLADPLLSGVTELWVSLHGQDPGEAGDQSTNEVDYTPYGRVSVSRDASGWVRTGNQVSPVSNITFPQVTGISVSSDVTHFGIGTAQTGPGELMYYGTVTPSITFVTGESPTLTTDTIIEER